MTQEKAAAAEQLLVDIFREIKDPDSIYAVVQYHSPTSMLPLLEHEDRWGQILSMAGLLSGQHARLASSYQAKALTQLNSTSVLNSHLQSLESLATHSPGDPISSNFKDPTWTSVLQEILLIHCQFE